MRNSELDRRSGLDRRKGYSLDYFSNGGTERRKYKDRRRSPEKREGWVRMGDTWASFKVEPDASLQR